MSETAKMRQTAIDLMQMALACLDEAGETDAALRLQHAISIANREQPMSDGDMLDDETIALPGIDLCRS